MLAYREALERYAEGKTARNVEILAAATGEDPALVRDACWLAMRADARIDLASLLAFQAWAVAQGFVATAATPAQLWDSSFIAWADSVRRPRSPAPDTPSPR
jgi:hypothetical protein